MYNVPPHMTPRGPRSPWQYVAIGGAACVACALIGGVTAVLVMRPRTEVRANAIASAEPTRVSQTTGGVGVTPVPTDIPEETAEPAGTPASSLRKRPAWGKMDTVRQDGFTANEYAPQLSRPDEAFMAAAPLSGEEASHAFLMCRMQSFAKSDAFAGDDLQARVIFGHTPLVVNDGPEDKNLAFVSAPLATLHKGDKVEFQVYDRDVFELETIAKPSTTWNGGALTVLDPGATIECRALTGDALQKLVSSYGAESDRAIKSVENVKLDPKSPNWGYPDYKIGLSKRAVGDVAGLVGWDDPRAIKRVASVDTVVAAIGEQRPVVFDGLYKTAGNTATVGMITVSDSRIACGPSGAGCTMHATLENHAQKPLLLSGLDGVSLYGATRDSGPRPAGFAHPNRTELAAGESMELAIEPERTLALGTSPSMLGVCLANQCQVLKLR